ncbi:hypothetical protein Back11_61210 [Paenibacillus baekrokdamisoli]|uniref:Uncharacterized protein n=1 Tax=Paenibacillus baekrokdamisoli TaxID=1712516 RepID=A0A3G9J1Y9_9BACL|nr:A24 family peptidase [Paenibacillus baekrokdamisoli]MBB3072193.1 prepilin peptidase CpaA [Paenibacillus baekrokdamisoli]BBH24776.1 hypothetical protein Back11_61210 [Paenibacillus baekrokdamisoli]
MAVTVSIGASALLLLLAFINDVRRMKIPNSLTVTFVIMGIGYHSVNAGLAGSSYSLLGAAAGFIPLLVLYALKGIGAGDVKLFAALGSWMGAITVFQVLAYAIFYAGAVGVFLLFVNGSFGRRIWMGILTMMVPGTESKREVLLAWNKNGLRFPFMIAVVPAALTVWYITYM